MIRRFHSLRSPLRHPLLCALLGFILICDALHILNIYRAQATSRQSSAPPRNSKRIFIAAQHWNNENLLRDRWNDALVALVKELGTENVYITIYESGSFDDTKGALRELDITLGELQVQRTITLSNVTRKDEISKEPTDHGWIRTPAGEMALRRIPFLAKLRNQILDTLKVKSSEGLHFDTVLFLNDVVFRVCTLSNRHCGNPTNDWQSEDVLRLLDTNNGNYAAACSLDFAKPPEFYDTFALRDSKGHEAVMQTWPYFRTYASRYAAQRLLPVPVTSCWNGMGTSR
jgi:hypothetical protein